MSLFENGTYRATVLDVSLFVRGEQERLTAAFRLSIDGKEIVHKEWIELNDGTISEKTIRRLRECFPSWDGNIETLEAGECCRNVEVDAVVENKPDKTDPSKSWSNVVWMNAPNAGGTGPNMPEAIDRKTLVSKYAAKFRALSGGVPSGKAPTKAPPPPPPKSAGKESTQEACWEALCKKLDGVPREAMSDHWFKVLEGVAPGKDQSDFNGSDWNKVANVISHMTAEGAKAAKTDEDNIPF